MFEMRIGLIAEVDLDLMEAYEQIESGKIFRARKRWQAILDRFAAEETHSVRFVH